MSTPELLPCPFCGGEPICDLYEMTHWLVECPVCTIGTHFYKNKQDAIDAYNTRVLPPHTQRVIDAAREYIRAEREYFTVPLPDNKEGIDAFFETLAPLEASWLQAKRNMRKALAAYDTQQKGAQ